MSLRHVADTARALVLVGLVCVAAARPIAAQVEVSEATITELQDAMASGRATSEQITAAYLARIRAYDQAGPRLNAMIRINPNALAEAAALDAERASRGPRGPLHGIPIILKDNYGTADMPTSAGTLSLAGMLVPRDAFQVKKLRDAGVVILGKSNMHELASGITTISSLGGQTLNPYDLGRNPGGSSGGTGAAIAASYAAVGWGSDTCGSIRIPSSQNDLFGLRPTKGLSSITGIVPLSHTQDVGGPLARTVTDLAIALDATVGPDPQDPATRTLEGRALPRFVASLDAGALGGARIGILEDYFGGGEEAERIVRRALGRLAELGADTLTVEVPDFDSLIASSSVINHEFKWDLIDYLAQVPNAPVDSLGEMLDVGLIHEALTPRMRQRNAPEARETEAYRAALAKRGPLRDAVVAVMEANRLDAIAYPTMRELPALLPEPQNGSTCQLSAATGLPAISIPAGWSAGGLPAGLELLGRSFDDARLVAFAYAFEQATDNRRAPWTTPPLVAGVAPPPAVFNVHAAAETGVGVDARARFTYDPLTGHLDYQVRVFGVEPQELYAVVLRHADDQGRWSVVERLSGPGAMAGAGSLTLDAAARSYFEAGELYLEVFTRAGPFGAARARLPWTFQR